MKNPRWDWSAFGKNFSWGFVFAIPVGVGVSKLGGSVGDAALIGCLLALSYLALVAITRKYKSN